MEVGKEEKQNIILGEEASVNGDVLTPLTPFNSLTPHLIPSSYESCSLRGRSKG